MEGCKYPRISWLDRLNSERNGGGGGEEKWGQGLRRRGAGKGREEREGGDEREEEGEGVGGDIHRIDTRGRIRVGFYLLSKAPADALFPRTHTSALSFPTPSYTPSSTRTSRRLSPLLLPLPIPAHLRIAHVSRPILHLTPPLFFLLHHLTPPLLYYQPPLNSSI